MKNRDLKEYLNTFPDDADISVVIMSRKENKRYPLIDYVGITDIGHPSFVFDIGKPEKMEDEAEADIPGQTDFNDFPEVLP